MFRAEINASSPLLRLPQEIKDQIYELAIGGMSIHIFESGTQEPNARQFLTNRICHAQISEFEAQELLEKALGENYQSAANLTECTCPTVERVHDRHSCCGDDMEVLRMNNLALLSSCRQIYSEVQPIFYAKTTFGFYGPPALERFVSSLSPPQRLMVRSIALTILPAKGCDVWHWKRGFRFLVKELQDVRSISLDLDLVRPFLNTGYEMMDDFKELAKLPLKRAAVVMRNGPARTFYYPGGAKFIRPTRRTYHTERISPKIIRDVLLPGLKDKGDPQLVQEVFKGIILHVTKTYEGQ